MARKYKRDSKGRFAGSSVGSGGGGVRARAKKTASKIKTKAVTIAKHPVTRDLAYVAGATAMYAAPYALATAYGSASTKAFTAAQTAARHRVATTSGIGAGSAMLRQSRRVNGVYKIRSS